MSLLLGRFGEMTEILRKILFSRMEMMSLLEMLTAELEGFLV
jgi:hypothetical protein